MSQISVLLVAANEFDLSAWQCAAKSVSLRTVACPPDEVNDEQLWQEAVSVVVGGADAGRAWMRTASDSELLRRLPTIIVLDDGNDRLIPDANYVRVWGALPRSHVESCLSPMLALASRYGSEVRRMFAFIRDFRQQVGELKERERQVMQLVCQGVSNKKIASMQGCSLRTVELRRSRVYAHLGVTTAAQLASLASTARAYQTLLELV
jgi:DNA-binding NarL/FixJ family response regulator